MEFQQAVVLCIQLVLNPMLHFLSFQDRFLDPLECLLRLVLNLEALLGEHLRLLIQIVAGQQLFLLLLPLEVAQPVAVSVEDHLELLGRHLVLVHLFRVHVVLLPEFTFLSPWDQVQIRLEVGESILQILHLAPDGLHDLLLVGVSYLAALRVFEPLFDVLDQGLALVIVLFQVLHQNTSTLL